MTTRAGESSARTPGATAQWVILNQSQAPAFQRLFGGLVRELGPCIDYTGAPFPPAPPGMTLVRGPAYDRRGFARRAWSWARFLAGASWLLLRTSGRPFLFVTTNPPFLMHLAALASLVRGNRYAILVWDLYPDHVVQIGWARRANPGVWLWRRLNRLAFCRAGAVIAIGENMAEAIRRQLAGASANVVVIPNWADVEEIRPIPKAGNAFAVAQGLVDKLTVMYSGNLGATHGVEVIADLAAELRDEPRIHFMVIGGGLGREALETRVGERGLGNVTFLDFQPQEVLPLSLAAADVALVLQAPGTEHLSIPSKTYNCLAAGSGLLAMTSSTSDLGRLVDETGAGAVCAIEDPRRGAALIRGWLDRPSDLAAAREAARRAAVDRFSAVVVSERFVHVLGAAMERGAMR